MSYTSHRRDLAEDSSSECALLHFQTTTCSPHSCSSPLPCPPKTLLFYSITLCTNKTPRLVGLLTEMDPLSNTSSTHEGTTRLLGLNRNRGQVIELRLRTDAYDGYRAYNTIRATLCHELAHNVHSPHDRKFWDLCHQIEREVAAASSGRSVGDGGGWEPSMEEEDAPDHGGWTGGTYVLGGGGGGGGSGGSGSGNGSSGAGGSSDAASGLSRRDVIAKAAEERMKRAREGGSAPPDDGAAGGSGTT